MPAARDFVTDAHAHHESIAHNATADRLFAPAGLGQLKDDGFVLLDNGGGRGGADFVARCRARRYWR